MVALPKEALHAGYIPDNVFTRDDVRKDSEFRCDVVIVGSGAGGASIPPGHVATVPTLLPAPVT